MSSSESKSPKALSRQHTKSPSLSPRFSVGLTPSPIRPLQRQRPVRDSMLQFTSFNGGPAQPPVTVYNPLPRRRQMIPNQVSPQSITQPRIPTIPNLVALNNRAIFQEAQRQFQRQTVIPPRRLPGSLAASILDPFAPFRNHMHMESGTTILELDDGTSIDMGNVDIDTALMMLRRTYTERGVVTYSIAGFPNIEMGILFDGSIRTLHNGGKSRKKLGRRTVNRKRRLTRHRRANRR